MISLADALKATRRGTYKYGTDWRALVIVAKNRQVPVLFDEVKSLTEASSMGIEMARYSTLTIQLDRGGMITMAAIEDLMDAYLYGGRTFTHIIWLYHPDDKVLQYVESFKRSVNVPTAELRTDFADW